MRKFKDEFKFPLDKVERNCLRRISVVLLSPLLFFLGAVMGALDYTYTWFKECW